MEFPGKRLEQSAGSSIRGINYIPSAYFPGKLFFGARTSFHAHGKYILSMHKGMRLKYLEGMKMIQE
jgi:hypothetical protein